MACNGNNHYADCDCAFSGGWKGGSRDFESEYDRRLFSRHLRDRTEARQRETWSLFSGGYTDPNATCPVCGAPVFFYQSPYGGRVFFDELGPPWPKHPCTDNAEAYPSVSFAAPTHSRVGNQPKRPWQAEGWRSLTEVYVDHVADDVYKIRSDPYELVFRYREPPAISAARMRLSGSGLFELSLLEYDERVGEWFRLEGVARLWYKGLLDSDQPLRKSKLESGAVEVSSPPPVEGQSDACAEVDADGKASPRRLVLIRKRSAESTSPPPPGDTGPAFELDGYLEGLPGRFPSPAYWNELWNMLPVGEGGRLAPAPLILAAAGEPAEAKAKRFREHILWAQQHGAIRLIQKYLELAPAHCWEQ